MYYSAQPHSAAWHWPAALLLALGLHAAVAAFLLLSPSAADSGDALSDGDLGLEVGLGMLGSYADSIERLAPPPKPVTPPPPAEPVKPAEQPKPVVKAAPKPTPRPQIAPKPVAQASVIRQVKPVQEKPAEAEVNTQETAAAPTPEAETESQPEKPQAAPSAAMQKATGRAQDQQAGGRTGNARSYIQSLMRWLAKHKRYPAAAKKDKQDGVVQLAFTIDRAGNVLSRSIHKSSGYPLLDQAALEMLKDASPLPAVPDDFYPARERLPLILPFEYSLIKD